MTYALAVKCFRWGYFGNESSESIQEYSILPKDNQETDILRPRQYPNCNEPYRPDQKFCVKCKMVLIYGAYSETIEEKQIKDKWEDQN